MPIRRMLVEMASFSPEDITVLTAAFEDCLRALDVADRNHPVALALAKRIIELARRGERDRARLCEEALNPFKNGTGL